MGLKESKTSLLYILSQILVYKKRNNYKKPGKEARSQILSAMLNRCKGRILTHN